VTQLTNAVVSTAALESHSRIVLQKYMQREMIRVGSEIYIAGFDGHADVFESLDEAEESLFSISRDIQGDALDVETVLMKTMNQIEEWAKMEGSITGVPSGFPGLDRATRGWQPGNLIILAARPSVGKTAMALRLARNAAKNDIREFPVAFWSLEMKSVQLMLRLLAAESDTNLHLLQTGKMNDAEKMKLHRHGVNELAKMKIFFDDQPGLSILKLRAKARRLKRKHNIGMIVIDYLQLMSGEGQTREQEISKITRSLKELAQELEIPIIALSQLSREIEKRAGDKRVPQLSDLRESGAIEQDADDVLFLWGPGEDDIKADAGLVGMRKLRIAKARNGMLTTVTLDFKGETQFFKEHQEIAGFVPVPGALF
jgi:replicative DNA helicase